MKTRTLKELLLYNYRYWLGYSIIASFILYFLGWKLGSLTGGLSAQELSTAAQNSSLSTIISNPIYPLHSLLQWVSIKLLGVDMFSLRISTAILGLLVAFILYQLLKKWFGKPTALLSTALFISADWFLFIARYSTGGIEFSFWLGLALLCFTKLIERNNKWLILYALSLGGLLFVPFGIYAVIILLISLFAGRLFRERAAQTSWFIKVPSVLILLIALGGCVFFSIRDFTFLRTLLGFVEIPSLLEYFKNVFINTSAVVAVLPDSNPTISPNGIFFVRFFELIFISFGILMLYKTRVNRLNLTVLVLSVTLVLASGLSQGSRGAGLVLIPAAIFMTAGIRHFIFRWQKIFPKNPYARITALLPLSLLFLSVVALHYISYFRLWPHQSATTAVFKSNLPLANEELKNKKYSSKVCYVETTDTNIKTLLQASKSACTLTFADDPNPVQPNIALLQPGAQAATSLLNAKTKPLVDSRGAANLQWVVVTE